jgi:outer membrane protein TolC
MCVRPTRSFPKRSRPFVCASIALFLALSVCAPPFESSASELSAETAALPAVPGLEEYVAHAAEASPTVRAAEARWDAAVEHASSVGALPDPVLTYGYFIEPVETRVGPQEQKFGLKQKLPWFGKLSSKRRAAASGADAAHERYRAARLALVDDVTLAYCEYAYLARAVEISERRLGLLVGLEEVVRAKYSAGSATYADLMKAQIALAKAESDLEALRDLRVPLSAALAAAAYLPDEQVLPWPAGLPEPRPVPTSEEAGAVLAESNPELLASDHEIDAALATLTFAERSQFPDLVLGFDYIVTGEAAMPVEDSGKDPVIATAAINVPLWFGATRAAVKEAEAKRAAAVEMRDDLEKRLEARLEMALYRLGDAERKVELYGARLVPMARQSLGAAQAAYEAGSSDFDALIAAEETLLEFELSLDRARSDRAQKEAHVDRLLGRGLTVPAADTGAGDDPEGNNP